MNINIYGSTGVIGKKTLELIEKNFSKLKINLLCAKSNLNLLKKQIKKFRPKYAFLYDLQKFPKLDRKIGNTTFLTFDELQSYLSSSKSNLSLLAISGYKSLYYLENIINNTDNLGIVNKEAIVSAGHIFKKNKFFNKTNIFPLDSEHFSLLDLFNKTKNDNISKVILTASGGPFHKNKFNTLNNIKLTQAINHPKWDMGYKNSIDSATLVNKCLELIEAHYLFDIPFDKLEILIHPEALVHSIVEFENYTTKFNLFKNDMSIPLLNFLFNSGLKYRFNNKKNFFINEYKNFNFEHVKKEVFPIYNFFKQIDKSKPQNIIKFNIGNEFAVNLFKNRLIKYTDIYKIIKKVTSLNLYSSVNTIKDIINYHEEIENELQKIKFHLH